MGIMTQFDTDLEERTRQRAQNLFQNAVAPAGPPAATATTERKTSPVTINIGGEGTKQSPYTNLMGPDFRIPTQFDQGLRNATVGTAGLPFSYATDVAANALNAANRGLGAIAGYQFPGEVVRNRTQDALSLVRMGGRDIASSLGMVPAPTRTPTAFTIPNEMAVSHVPGLEAANRVIEMAKSPGGTYEAAPPNVGWFQIEGGPKRTITDEYWRTPMTGGGSFNVIPGSAAGPQFAPPVTLRMYGKDYTLPAATVAELGQTFQREQAPRMPEFTIPTEYQTRMDDLMKIIKAPMGSVGGATRTAAAHALGDLQREVTEMNRQTIDVWKTQMGYPLEERKVGAQETGAYAHAKTAEAQLMMAGPHADYFKKLASEGTLVPPGYAIFNPETRKAMFENPQKSEAFAPLARDALLASTEDTPTGKIVNPFAFMGYMNLMGKTVSREKRQEWKDIAVKDMNKEMVAPYIHRIIQTNPKTMKLKPESKEYQQLYNDTLRELYKD